MSKILVAPSILSADFGKVAEAVKNIKNWGADLVHCDVMDGVFVPNLTFGMPMIKAISRYSELPVDVHLMITEPERYVEKFCDAGADILTFHPDASKNTGKTLDMIKAKGKKCGLVLNPDKPLSLIEPYLNKIDVVIIMSVYAGFGGQKFIEEILLKIVDAKRMFSSYGQNIILEVDGGVTTENAGRIIYAGADILVAGNAVFNAENPSLAVEKIRG
ncbi:MAG TPA: ribulose-phosphate 3-epimerase [Clostridia bacterium]|nr:ribulose-phosphate 3-epimerase [Clostridia bacterium]